MISPGVIVAEEVLPNGSNLDSVDNCTAKSGCATFLLLNSRQDTFL